MREEPRRSFREPQLVDLLEVEPELARGAEEAAEPESRVAGNGPLRTKGGKNGRIPGWSGSGLLDAVDRGDADIEVARQLPD